MSCCVVAGVCRVVSRQTCVVLRRGSGVSCCVVAAVYCVASLSAVCLVASWQTYSLLSQGSRASRCDRAAMSRALLWQPRVVLCLSSRVLQQGCNRATRQGTY